MLRALSKAVLINTEVAAGDLVAVANDISRARWTSPYLVSNGYWSPAYPALLAVTLKLARPALAEF